MAAKPELLSALRSVRSSGFLRIVSEFYDSTKVDISNLTVFFLEFSKNFSFLHVSRSPYHISRYTKPLNTCIQRPALPYVIHNPVKNLYPVIYNLLLDKLSEYQTPRML